MNAEGSVLPVVHTTTAGPGMGSHHQGATAALSRWEATVGNPDTTSIVLPSRNICTHTHSLHFSPKIFSLFNILLICLCVCSHINNLHTSRFPWRPEKGTECLTGCSSVSVQVLGTEPWSSGRATSALNHWSISPASLFTELVRLKKMVGRGKIAPRNPSCRVTQKMLF